MSSKSKDLKILDNKQLIHIASEVVVLLGVVFYFSSKNKKLSGHIEELAQRIEEQEEHIQKIETTFQQMSTALNSVIQRVQETDRAVDLISKDVVLLTDKFVQEEVETLKPTKSAEQGRPRQVEQVRSRQVEQVRPRQVEQGRPRQAEQVKHVTPLVQEVSQTQRTPKVKFAEEENESDSDLDAEIRAELEELTEDETNLKKET